MKYQAEGTMYAKVTKVNPDILIDSCPKISKYTPMFDNCKQELTGTDSPHYLMSSSMTNPSGSCSDFISQYVGYIHFYRTPVSGADPG